MKKLSVTLCFLFFVACQMVPVQEMIYLQNVQTSKTQSQKIFINAFDSKADHLLFEVSKNDFKKRYKDPLWKYVEITKIEEIGPNLDSYLKAGPIDELVLNAHGSSFALKIGKNKLTKSNLKKINFKGSLAPNSKFFLLSCSVGQKSAFQFGTPFVEKLGQAFMKNKGTVYASTKLMVYPWEYIKDIGVQSNYKWYQKALGYLLVPIIIPVYQYLTWSPWDSKRIREIKI